ncbi:MAG: 2-phospho-L-lactate transferase [Acidimicrobiia bacterium]|nr:2-phospho-L-lactate transferase [Acidimicrobiia bacterium]MYG60138.1 2-phospho-L-lactate transferase [Acidimicrobiia bacterium]MYJ32306.1 2-phospho-L-lactate transferase [Acidimicrobiia bacterium]
MLFRGDFLTPSVVTLAGGVGAAKLLTGLIRAHPPNDLLAVVNTADDTVLHGLHVSPDLDTVVYTLAGAVNPDTGWGLAGETWQAMDALDRYGGITWFRLGDRDLATHLYRTHRLGQGADLAAVTAEVAAAWGLELAVLPVTNDRIETRVTTADEGEIGFQDYFVRRRHNVAVSAVRVAGSERARPSPGLLEALAAARLIIIAPSNPIVSIGPVLEVPGVRQAVADRRDAVVAVSPIVGGAALKGPADRLMRELSHECSVVGVARLYRDVAATLVIDEADAHLADDVEAEGVACVVAPTIMDGIETATDLARVVLGYSAEGAQT